MNKEVDKNSPRDEEVESNLEAIQEELEIETDVACEEGKKYKSMYEENQKSLEEVNNRLLRLQADFTNYKKRIDKEKDSLYTYASQELITQLLPIIDNFERALVSNDDKMKNDSFYQGMEMIYKQLIDTLKNNGLEEIEAVGQKFDHNFHHGVVQEESADHEEGTILEVFQKGYKLKDRVIRPSMVKISK